ncbi:hypothetical protein NE235_27830 [Actinoallomurus spadix]|uniref:DUF4276 family protein n=1 Tax=Actinoallomurus spadix TaxID=79912 RepID=A0ABN0WI84_9ACTN|nr:hypothetical protein [Actinoallomurus spadix]MCO5989929.1 hypothetical protein [Actinoallomurus spadix]
MLAGEDRNDRRSLRVLLEAACPDMRGRIVEINDPMPLRQASGANLSDRVGRLARLARARAARENADLACVFVHEDLDAADGDEYLQTRKRVQKALEAELGTAHYVLAVAEIEAWLLLFPEALAGLVSSWSVPKKYLHRDTGKLSDPKRILMREVGSGSRRYRESDAPDVLVKAVELGCHTTPVGTNRSWVQLHADAVDCCREHLKGNRG